MKHLRNPDGTALVSVMILAALLVPIGTWMALQARLDGVVTRSLRADLHAFYVADAGLSEALAVLSRLPSAAAALAGPDGISGNADDGGIIGPPGLQVPFPAAPFGYRTELRPQGADGVRVRSSGYGWGGGIKQVEAVVFWRDGRVLVWWSEVL